MTSETSSEESRTFTGKLEYLESSLERRFEAARLKSYLKGFEYFTFGKDKYKMPIFYRTDTGTLLHEAIV